jgi:hypothetical protein
MKSDARDGDSDDGGRGGGTVARSVLSILLPMADDPTACH